MSVEQILLAGITTVSTALTTALAILWRIVDRNRRECEEDRRQLWNHLIKLQPLSCSVDPCEERQRIPLPTLKLSKRGRKTLEAEAE